MRMNKEFAEGPDYFTLCFLFGEGGVDRLCIELFYLRGEERRGEGCVEYWLCCYYRCFAAGGGGVGHLCVSRPV